MNPKQRYLDEVRSHLLATEEERERFIGDLTSHFAEGEARGETPARIIDRLGSSEAVAAAFNAERELAFAGFWRRLAAFFCDAGILLFAALPLIAAAAAGGRHGPGGALVLAALVLFGLAAVGFGLLYFPLFEGRFGWTPGKRLMRIRVIHENGGPITIGQAFVRRLSFYFDLMLPDALFIPFTDRKQRALDILAKTIVVREPGPPPGFGAWILAIFGWLVVLGVFLLICLTMA